MDVNPKPGCLEFLAKSYLYSIPVVSSFMMAMIQKSRCIMVGILRQFQVKLPPGENTGHCLRILWGNNETSIHNILEQSSVLLQS